MRRRQRSLAPRDQHPSEFASILMRLCDTVEAIGAALVDGEGETVDYAATVDPFDMKLLAAEASVLLSVLRGVHVFDWDHCEELFVRGARKGFCVQTLPHGYALVVLLAPRCFALSRRATSEAVREICREAGLDLPERVASETERWYRVEVRCRREAPRRPDAIWLDGAWRSVDVLGRYSDGLRDGELGYRARASTGAELTLVRERLGRWYADIVHSEQH